MERALDDVRLLFPDGQSLALRLAKDERGRLLWQNSTLKFLPISQPTRARYGALQPEVGDVYVQLDLSGGFGQKYEVPAESPAALRYWYGQYIDTSGPGIRKGPAVTTLAITGNVAGLDGYLELGGTPYLVLGKTIASWASDSLTQKYTDTNTMSGGATFITVGSETSIEAGGVTDTTASDVQSSDARVAQQFRHSAASLRYLSRVDVKLIAATATAAGDVRLRLYTDQDGNPGEPISTARMLYTAVPTTAGGTVMRFRFEDDDVVALEPDAPYWLVLDMASASATNYVSWRRDATSGYARGTGKTSADGGNLWSAAAGDYHFTVYGRTPTATAFVGRGTAATWLSSTDGTTWTADTYRKANRFCVSADRLVADVAGVGAVIWSDDGINWSEPIVVGDPAEAVTELYDLQGTLIVAKTGSVWAVDISAATVGATPTMQPLYAGGAVSTNGRGGCVFRGVALLPFAGRVVGFEGDLTNGFTVHDTIGPESAEDTGGLALTGTLCLAADRFSVWALCAGTAGVEVFRSFDPTRKAWHGSQHTLTTVASTAVKMAAVYDPGGTSSPQLFVQHTTDVAAGTAAKVGRITLSRERKADASWRYDIASTGALYFPYSTGGGFDVHPKAWVEEATTFLATSASDYVEVTYDTLDGEGYRRLGGPLYDTDRLPYPDALTSRLLGRCLRLINSAATASPVVLATGVGYSVLPLGDKRELLFSVLAEDGLDGMAIGGTALREQLLRLPAAGTLQLEDYEGHRYRAVRVIEARDVLGALGDGRAAMSVVQIRAMGDAVEEVLLR